jgi:hypothetical protein
VSCIEDLLRPERQETLLDLSRPHRIKWFVSGESAVEIRPRKPGSSFQVLRAKTGTGVNLPTVPPLLCCLKPLITKQDSILKFLRARQNNSTVKCQPKEPSPNPPVSTRGRWLPRYFSRNSPLVGIAVLKILLGSPNGRIRKAWIGYQSRCDLFRCKVVLVGGVVRCLDLANSSGETLAASFSSWTQYIKNNLWELQVDVPPVSTCLHNLIWGCTPNTQALGRQLLPGPLIVAVFCHFVQVISWYAKVGTVEIASRISIWDAGAKNRQQSVKQIWRTHVSVMGCKISLRESFQR